MSGKEPSRVNVNAWISNFDLTTHMDWIDLLSVGGGCYWLL